jgi:hypothetical protein
MNVTLLLQFRHPGPPFPTLLRPAGHPQNGLKFWLVGRSVGRLVCLSQGSYMNVTLPLQFRHPGLPFRTLLRPEGHPQSSFKFWFVGRSRGSHTNVTLPLQFHHPGLPFLTLLCPAGHPKNSLQFWSVGRRVSWSVGQLVDRSQGSHTNVTLPLQFRHLGPPFPTLLRHGISVPKFYIS